MFGLGAMEIGMILVAALIFLGPQKLPEVAKTVGKTMRDLQRAANDFTREINNPAVNYPTQHMQAEGQEPYSPEDDMETEDPDDNPYHAIALEEEALAQADHTKDTLLEDESTDDATEAREEVMTAENSASDEDPAEALQKT